MLYMQTSPQAPSVAPPAASALPSPAAAAAAAAALALDLAAGDGDGDAAALAFDAAAQARGDRVPSSFPAGEVKAVRPCIKALK